MLRNKTDEEILSLPKMTDRVQTTTVKLLIYVCFFCLTRDDEMQATHAALLALELTLKGGPSPHSANALTFYGKLRSRISVWKAALKLQKQELQ